MHEIHLNIWINDDGSLGSDFTGTVDDALKMIGFSVHLLAKSQQIHHLEILSSLRGVLDNGSFESEIGPDIKGLN